MTEYNDILYIVVPCYNEEEVLHETSKRLKEKMTTLINDRKISDKSRVLFVDDGSKDRTWEISRPGTRGTRTPFLQAL